MEDGKTFKLFRAYFLGRVPAMAEILFTTGPDGITIGKKVKSKFFPHRESSIDEDLSFELRGDEIFAKRGDEPHVRIARLGEPQRNQHIPNHVLEFWSRDGNAVGLILEAFDCGFEAGREQLSERFKQLLDKLIFEPHLFSKLFE